MICNAWRSVNLCKVRIDPGSHCCVSFLFEDNEVFGRCESRDAGCGKRYKSSRASEVTTIHQSTHLIMSKVTPLTDEEYNSLYYTAGAVCLGTVGIIAFLSLTFITDSNEPPKKSRWAGRKLDCFYFWFFVTHIVCSYIIPLPSPALWLLVQETLANHGCDSL